MKMELEVTIDGEKYILSGTAKKVEHIHDDYKFRAKVIAKAIKSIKKPRTVARITEEVRKENQMSVRFVRKILGIYDGELWESSEYRSSVGGKPTTQYKIMKDA